MGIVLTILAVIFVFGLIIFIHEAGHFLAARLVGVGVYEFSLGFGPRLGGFKRHKTEYNLRLVPLGGYVRLVGMDPEDKEREAPYSFARKPVWSRMLVILAGPFMNFFLAVLMLAIVFFWQGIPVATTRIAEVLPHYPAAAAGFKPGDRIVAIDGQPVNSWKEIAKIIGSGPSQERTITVERDGKFINLVVSPQPDETGKNKIGIVPVVVTEHPGLLGSLKQGVVATANMIKLIFLFLGHLLLHQAPADIGGPVRIAVETGKVAQMGLSPLLQFTAFLSINVGFFNLLPIPALDGARFLFLLWEGVTRRPLDPKKENLVHLVGFALLLFLIVVITYRDLLHLTGGMGK
ncbi:membrane-associated zinc metalloprotease [Ammonifex degensii KC4]|uniref:Zinc metalloprotease n=1 Tax=Ammonifex degensii (strain DSM 10501 / KC4) TaxID=429009 RepID=C9RBV8_AMMDK|nr:RIP metalloprotease RseP [Ammonifex degensii]ACX51735.1 membrane-associated zinc metalloprotease [Ammonifex degensii KC4]